MVKMKTKETVLVIALAPWAVQQKCWSYLMPAAQGSKASTAIVLLYAIIVLFVIHYLISYP